MHDTMESGLFSAERLALNLQSLELIVQEKKAHLETYLFLLTKDIDCDSTCLEIDEVYLKGGIKRTYKDIINEIKEVLGRE